MHIMSQVTVPHTQTHRQKHTLIPLPAAESMPSLYGLCMSIVWLDHDQMLHK